MKNIKSKIQKLLEEKPFLKDCDSKLCTHIWFREMKSQGFNPYETPSTEMLLLYSQKKLTQAPTIKRARAKLQEENPSLRGLKYHKRQNAQPLWKKKLGYEV